MSLTQTQINQAVDSCVTKYQGQQVAFLGYPGQCLSLVKQYIKDTYDIAPPASGNGEGSGYYTDLPAPLQEYFTKENWVSGQAYPKGSLVVNVATDHIALLVASGPVDATVFEQNADPDGSPAHEAQRANSRLDGVLVPIVATTDVVTTAAPQTPTAAATQSQTYQVLSTIKGYREASQAAARANPTAEVEAGSYYQFNTSDGMINVTKIQGEAGSWINPADNVEVVPAPVPTTPTLGVATIFLPAAAGTWHIYNVGGPYTLPHAIPGRILEPGKFPPGLTYTILEILAPFVYKIQTEDYGVVAIYGGPDTIAKITQG